MTGAKSSFKIIYENILGNFGWLLSKERIFDEKSHFHQPYRVRRSKKKKRDERAFLVASTLGENGCLVPQLYLSRHILLIDNAG